MQKRENYIVHTIQHTVQLIFAHVSEQGWAFVYELVE